MSTLSATPIPLQSTAMTRAGWGLTGLFALFMIFDAVLKLIGVPVVEETLIQLGYPAGLGFQIGILEVVLLGIYLAPRTAILGAVLYTGLFGGAIASHIRVQSPLYSHVLFGVYLGLAAWGGLWLRDPKLRALFPMRP